jgi:hypothetical protein
LPQQCLRSFFPLCFQSAHRDDSINSQSPRGPALYADRPYLELAVLALEDAVVARVVGVFAIRQNSEIWN